MSSIIAGVTWGRSSRPSGGKGRWHLLAEARRNTSGARIQGRWGAVEPGGYFAVALCGMAINDPEWEPQPKLVARPWIGSGMMTPDTDYCLPCAEASVRQSGSVLV